SKGAKRFFGAMVERRVGRGGQASAGGLSARRRRRSTVVGGDGGGARVRVVARCAFVSYRNHWLGWRALEGGCSLAAGGGRGGVPVCDGCSCSRSEGGADGAGRGCGAGGGVDARKWLNFLVANEWGQRNR